MSNTEFYGVFKKSDGDQYGGTYSTPGIARNVASGYDEWFVSYSSKWFGSPEDKRKFEIRKLTPVLKAQDNGAFTLGMEWVRV